MNIQDYYLNKYVIVRTYSAGIHFGFLEKIEETTTILRRARRLYYWKGAFTLSEISIDGIKDGKISKEIDSILLTQSIEIIPCTDSVKDQLMKFKAFEI